MSKQVVCCRLRLERVEALHEGQIMRVARLSAHPHSAWGLVVVPMLDILCPVKGNVSCMLQPIYPLSH